MGPQLARPAYERRDERLTDVPRSEVLPRGTNERVEGADTRVLTEKSPARICAAQPGRWSGQKPSSAM
jgi:hypothetical protein